MRVPEMVSPRSVRIISTGLWDAEAMGVTFQKYLYRTFQQSRSAITSPFLYEPKDNRSSFFKAWQTKPPTVGCVALPKKPCKNTGSDKAVKQIRTELDQLKQENQDLKSRLEALEAKAK